LRSEGKPPQLGIDVLVHDIKNVFNNISSSIELCKIFLSDSKNTDNVSEQFYIVNGQIARGLKLMSNVRKLYKNDQQSTPKIRTDILAKLNEAITLVKKSFQDKTLNIKINSFNKTIFVDADEEISDVFENLLFNAVLHNMNIKVDIHLHLTKIQKGDKTFLKIEFIDNGIGVNDKRKEWMFKENDKKSKSGKGMGFGLTLVKKIVESYGGSICVEDRIKGDYSQGSNFVILIPV